MSRVEVSTGSRCSNVNLFSYCKHTDQGSGWNSVQDGSRSVVSSFKKAFKGYKKSQFCFSRLLRRQRIPSAFNISKNQDLEIHSSKRTKLIQKSWNAGRHFFLYSFFNCSSKENCKWVGSDSQATRTSSLTNKWYEDHFLLTEEFLLTHLYRHALFL